MSWHEITMKPRDILFFRDAKPMEASSVGAGGNWPLPNVFRDALICCMKVHWPERQDWEFEHKHRNEYDNRDNLSEVRFGGLKTAGLFPFRDGELYYPAPADICPDGSQMLLDKMQGNSNLPDFIKYGCSIHGKPSKKKAPAWITSVEMEQYLNGERLTFDSDTLPLFDVENRVGNAINPESGAVKEGQLYIAEYMRLREDVELKGYASCESHCRGKGNTDVVQKFFDEESNRLMVLGGQQGVVQVTASEQRENLADVLPGGGGAGCFVKWILLTPAIYNQGWLPDWIDEESGDVQLPAERPERRAGETRREWRERFTNPVKAKLVAARMEKACHLSGWNLRKKGPRATRLAVPAGSVYWFKAETSDDAAALSSALHGRFKSNYYGERGYGLGICKVLDSIEIKGE